jgi:hypothetical protein
MQIWQEKLQTIKQMMIQQTETMNTFMMLMARNEERQQEIPIRVLQQPSTPSSTITNSQYSQSQQSTSANKRKIDGIADDETAAVSTVVNGPNSREDDDIDAMLEEQSDVIEEIRNEQEEINDTKMTDKDHNTTSQQQQEQQESTGINRNQQESTGTAGNNRNNRKQQETTTTRITVAIAEGDFSHQFSNKPKSTDMIKQQHSKRGGPSIKAL